ncbi:hypothetical protein D9613_008750 [Agrocybe pediades]|uniref:Uncharacterized protein n=1 Tax=Agrocybe pediades TaxID=84607 RepID=A0A8H4QSN5_9AGAR|nr:hypothetical protein D9613_008750 [Agrocybe pediades]
MSSCRRLLSPSHAKTATKGVVPDDLSEYSPDFGVLVDFISQLHENMRLAGGEYQKSGIDKSQISTADYLDRITRFYCGQLSENHPAIIPDIQAILPPGTIFHETFYPKLLNSIAYSLEHPCYPEDESMEAALSAFIDSWAASSNRIPDQPCDPPSAYCLVEAEAAYDIPNFFGNSASRGESKPRKTIGEKIAERLYRRAVFYPNSGGVLPPSEVPGRPADHCGEVLAWGYIERYVETLWGSNMGTMQVVIKSLSMTVEKKPIPFCDDCIAKARAMVQRYPGLRMVDCATTTEYF